jgi:2-dehydro-3-deoxygluconokinase
MTAVVCIGEAMGQIVPSNGDVATATEFHLNQAGAESNTAIALARLGVDVAWVGRVGGDPLGHRVVSRIADEGVDIVQVLSDPQRNTGLFIKQPAGLERDVRYYRESSAASRMGPADIDRALSLSPQVIHLSGITPALSESCDAAVEYALETCRESGVMVSFDINFRAVLWPHRDVAARRLADIAKRCQIVFVGRDEAFDLWQTSTTESIASALDGASIVVVKDGAEDASSVEAGVKTVVKAPPVDVVESVGAGDAFAAGWLAGMLHGESPAFRLKLGHLAARRALSATDDIGAPASLGDLLLESYELWGLSQTEESR